MSPSFQHDVIVSLAPQKIKLRNFWVDLVINQKVGLIVNLCREAGALWTWDFECLHYWPTVEDRTIMDSDVSIKLGKVDEVCDYVIAYQLFVQPIVNWQLGKVHEVTLIHYSGWR